MLFYTAAPEPSTTIGTISKAKRDAIDQVSKRRREALNVPNPNTVSTESTIVERVD